MLSILLLLPLYLLTARCANITNSTIQSQYNSNNFQYQGVAIGGWLVLEPYITPSLFLAFNQTANTTEKDIPVDEYHYCKKLGYEEAEKRLTQHWDTFYTENDFADIKNAGLNMVRIPIGYWAFQKLDGDPYVSGAQDYLDKALEWAKNNDLKVWIDLHGVPGSQNGFDNSGFRDIGYPGWFNSTENVNLTKQVLHQIYHKYGTGENAINYRDTILGIEVVNEPFTPKLSMSRLQSFYIDTYIDSRKTQTLNNTIVIHDGFEGIGYWNDFLAGGKVYSNSSYLNSTNSTSKFSKRDNYFPFNATNITAVASAEVFNVLIDHHHYEVFASSVASNITTHLSNIRGYSQSIKDELKYHPAVVGEWSAALTDCTPWLNGVGLGARYAGEAPYDNTTKVGKCDNINNFDKWTKQQKKNTRKFIEIQLDQYSRYSNGWIFWCWKTETTIEWDFKKLVELDLMPQPLNNFTYIVNGTDTDPDSGASLARLSLFIPVASVLMFVAFF
ncbi:hypothetical protein G9P44_003284 [Scheffersomyces stipitis]|nr:hypothetical protein G9P44_003284 [Scheffersomyces stipitis]